MRITKIISSGQTGASIGALDAAIHCDLPHGGYCPKDRKQEKGKKIPQKYNLTEIKSPFHIRSIEANILDSDATIIFFIIGAQKRSEIHKVMSLCDKHNKPAGIFLASGFFDEEEHASIVDEVTRWFSGRICDNTPPHNCVLNVVGSKESKAEYIEEDVKLMMIDIISAINNKESNTIQVFIYNETRKDISASIADDTVVIHPKKSQIFNIVNPEQIIINEDIIIGTENNMGLEVDDKRSQISGIGRKYYRKYNVPKEVGYAFKVVPKGKGDESI